MTPGAVRLAGRFRYLLANPEAGDGCTGRQMLFALGMALKTVRQGCLQDLHIQVMSLGHLAAPCIIGRVLS